MYEAVCLDSLVIPRNRGKGFPLPCLVDSKSGWIMINYDTVTGLTEAV